MDEHIQDLREAELAAVLEGKNFSILGDSISTYEGYSNNTAYNATIGDNALYYTNTDHFDLGGAEDTWWMQAADAAGMQLLVNNSWSGDRLGGSGQALSRCVELDNTQDVPPDVIAVYIGINDFNSYASPDISAEDFAGLYREMLQKIKAKYADADVFCFTLLPNGDMGGSLRELRAFNAAIEAAAGECGYYVVDLYNDSGITEANMAAYYGDTESQTLHPNSAGMDCITDCFVDVLCDVYVADAA